MLEFITEYQVLFIDRRKLILTDNGCQGTRISYLCIAGEQLVPLRPDDRLLCSPHRYHPSSDGKDSAVR